MFGGAAIGGRAGFCTELGIGSAGHHSGRAAAAADGADLQGDAAGGSCRPATAAEVKSPRAELLLNFK